MRAGRLIGLGFIIVGNMGGLWLLFGNVGSVLPILRGDNLSLLVAGGFVILVAFGILMFTGELNSRSPQSSTKP